MGKNKDIFVENESNKKNKSENREERNKEVQVAEIKSGKSQRFERIKAKIISVSDKKSCTEESGIKNTNNNSPVSVSDINQNWIRCLVVIKKINRKNDIISPENSLESKDPRSLNSPKNSSHSAPYSGEAKKVIYSCLPNIFKSFYDAKNEENSAEFDNFIFPRFRKCLFDATWRGGTYSLLRAYGCSFVH